MEDELKNLESIAAREDINNPNTSWEIKAPMLLEVTKRFGSMSLGLLIKMEMLTIQMEQVLRLKIVDIFKVLYQEKAMYQIR